MTKRGFRDFSGNDYSFEQFLDACKRLDSLSYQFSIGTDSQVVKNNINIVTCICAHAYGVGCKVFYQKNILNARDFPTLRSRLLHETYSSLEMAIQLEEILKDRPSVHLDVGKTKRSSSNKYRNELEMIVRSQGYECVTKPDSFAAACADMKVRD
jgi:predicted RNase H-related nuclease YkuK (DUF458 family)